LPSLRFRHATPTVHSPLSLHAALAIWECPSPWPGDPPDGPPRPGRRAGRRRPPHRPPPSRPVPLGHHHGGGEGTVVAQAQVQPGDRKSTRLNSSHVKITYAVFCLKKKK